VLAAHAAARGWSPLYFKTGQGTKDYGKDMFPLYHNISLFQPFRENFTHLWFIVIFCWYVIKSCTDIFKLQLYQELRI